MIERTMINSRLESIEARLSLIDKNIGTSATKKIMYFPNLRQGGQACLGAEARNNALVVCKKEQQLLA